MLTADADYIFVGGGLTGCATAGRLYQSNPSLKIIIIEVGPDASDNPNVAPAMGSFLLTASDLDWQYPSLPDTPTNSRVHINNAGKALGGGRTINYAGWSRGDVADYNEWGAIVGDSRWSYAGLLPFFKKSETYFDKNANPEQHGFDGPIHVISVSASDPNRLYGLRQPLLDAWTELGVRFNSDPAGSTAGISEYTECWRDGHRQPAYQTYGIGGITILTDTRVDRVVFSKDKGGEPVASGVQLSDGRIITVRKEVVISAGTFRTPQILMLSGIGSATALSYLKIPLVYDAPDVGQNLFDHFAHFQLWKVRRPEEGLAMGTPKWNTLAYSKGIPCDWAVNEEVPSHLLPGSMESDSLAQKTRRCHVESTVIYAPTGIPGIPMNGNFIASSVMLNLPTSRGSVTLASASSSDQEIEQRIRATGVSHKHAGGTAAMDKVVMPDLKVIGVGGLRIVDASVLPVPIGGHTQATLYALAEQAAEIIQADA